MGDRISHPMFGNGIVRGIDQNKLTIEFSENVTKEIIAGYVKRRSSQLPVYGTGSEDCRLYRSLPSH